MQTVRLRRTLRMETRRVYKLTCAPCGQIEKKTGVLTGAFISGFPCGIGLSKLSKRAIRSLNISE